MSFSDYIDDVIPGWMRRSKREHWVSLSNSVAHVIDGMIDGLFEGRLAAMPGQIDAPDLGGFESVDALPFIGRDRRLVQGPTETPVEYAARLRAWRSAWRTAGVARGLLGAIRAVMVPTPPLLRVVSSAGAWWSLAEDGTLTFNTTTGLGCTFAPDGTATPNDLVAHPWDWDGTASKGRIWPIVYAPCHEPFLAGIDGQYGDGLSPYRATPEGTIGTTAPRNYVELIRGVVSDWKPAGIQCPNIIIAFDPASFDPATPGPYPAAGMPDGTWQNFGKAVQVGDEVHWLRTRLATARYWKGTS